MSTPREIRDGPVPAKPAASGFDEKLDRHLHLSHRGAVASEALEIFGEALDKRARDICLTTYRELDAGELTPDLALQRFAQLREIASILDGLKATSSKGEKAAARARKRVPVVSATGGGA